MIDRGRALALLPQAFGETGAGAHVGAGLQDAPEVAGIALEGLPPERPFSRSDAGLVLAPRLGEGLRLLLSQQNMGIGAEIGDLQRPFGQPDPPARRLRLPGVIDEVLGAPQRFLFPAGGTIRRHPVREPGHHPLHRTPVGHRRQGRWSGPLPAPRGRGPLALAAAVPADRHGILGQSAGGPRKIASAAADLSRGSRQDRRSRKMRRESNDRRGGTD